MTACNGPELQVPDNVVSFCRGEALVASAVPGFPPAAESAAAFNFNSAAATGLQPDATTRTTIPGLAKTLSDAESQGETPGTASANIRV